jgi:DNA-binding CsgD family transcriptional regulator
VASPPTVALGALVIARQEELRRSELELGALAEVYRATSAGRTVRDVVDVVTGSAAVGQRFRQLHAGAREEVLAFVLPDVLVVSSEENVEEDAAAARGVRYRVIVERGVLDRPGYGQVAEESMARGEELRVSSRLPGRLVVVDRSLAMVPMRAGEPGEDLGALLVHASPLLDLLVALFESEWAAAAPLGHAGEQPTAERLTPLDQRILALLDVGLTERALANHLGLSQRTVQRRVRHLMELAGVDTRFRLGVEAARRGWATAR